MKFFMGVGRYRLDLKGCRSLKDKRRIVKSIIDRIGNGKAVAVREIGDHDYWKSSMLAVVCLSDSEQAAKQALARSLQVMENAGIDVMENGCFVFSSDDVAESILCQGE
ncbi:MAG: DUF503 domain-containing protein [Actinobacteria bacterium]|nr:DUF503 domain-containing protein [Actinomycetota bacterium]